MVILRNLALEKKIDDELPKKSVNIDYICSNLTFKTKELIIQKNDVIFERETNSYFMLGVMKCLYFIALPIIFLTLLVRWKITYN